MRAITKEEAGNMMLKSGRSSPLRVALLKMKPGQLLLLDRKDVVAKKGPGEMLTRISNTTRKYSWKTRIAKRAVAKGRCGSTMPRWKKLG